MAIKRLITEEQKKNLRDTAPIRAKAKADLNNNDIKELVIIMASRMGLLK